MRKNLLFGVLLVIFLVLGGYLVMPTPAFPEQPPETLRSTEPADTESIYRRSYFTNLSREELMDYYWKQMGGWGLKLILPPEDSFTVIRDQTRSSYLEEIVHPGRDYLYVNAYVPTSPAEQINRNGIHYLNKVTIRYVPSHPVVRLTVLGLTMLLGYLLIKEYGLAKR
jgi:hypothetical protein